MEYEYLRNLPDGSRQCFSSPPEKPKGDQPYFDDFLKLTKAGKSQYPLELHFFGREQSYPGRALTRVTSDYILHYITEGKGMFNGKQLSKGQGFVVLSNKVHTMSADMEEPWHFKWISFGGSDAQRILRSVGLDEKHLTFDFDFGEEIERLAEDVLYKDHSDCDMNTYLQGVFYIILSHHKGHVPAEHSDSGGVYVEEAVRYIDSHYREDIRIESLAAALHISRKYLSSAFCRHMGMTTKEYLLRRRLDAASELLLVSDMSVSEIAEAVGYEDYTQLTRLFRLKKGMSPRQYRKTGVRGIEEVTFYRPPVITNK